MARWLGGWVAGSIETKAISASNLKLKLKLTEAELGKMTLCVSMSYLPDQATSTYFQLFRDNKRKGGEIDNNVSKMGIES